MSVGGSTAALLCLLLGLCKAATLAEIADRAPANAETITAVIHQSVRPDAAAACRGGHVRVNDRPAKPSTMVSPGDEVRARVGDTTRIVEVARVIQKRVGAADAVTCYLDRTPAPPPPSSVPVAARDRGAGRPTKRDRRILDKWLAGQG